MNALLIIASLFVSTFSQTIVDLAGGDARLTTLVEALTNADGDLLTVLSGAGPFTVFAPTDEAFDEIAVPNDTEVLSTILQYHVLSGEVLSTALESGLVATTIISQTITCQIDDNEDVFFYDSMGRASQVIEADIQATNGVIHIIDSVLLPGGTLANIASNVATLSDLFAALAANSLDALLAAPGNYTVFAPSNDAVDAFAGDIDAGLLSYHVLGDQYLSGDIPDGETVLPTLNAPNTITVIKDDTGVYVKDAVGRIATVTMANIATTNGVVHIIDMVLASTAFGTVVDLALEDSRLTSLVQELGKADGDLVTALSGTGPFTVFAPTNDAFSDITVPTDTAELANILTYHVLSGAAVSAGELSSGLVRDTLQGESITFQIDDNGDVFIYDSMGMASQVTQADITGTNGIIHIIDAVLLPGGTVVDIVSNIDSLSMLADALTDAELISTLSNEDGNFTVFAPTNEAIAAFTGTIDTELLLYHVLGDEYLSDNIPTGSTVLTTANVGGDEVTVIKNGTGVFIEDALGRVATVTMANIAGTNGVVHIIDIVLANRESPTIVDLAGGDARLTTLVEALTNADGDLLTVLSGAGPFTVFAPTNDAFEDITVPSDTAVLSNILQYHVLSGEVLSTTLTSGLVAPTIISQTITCQRDDQDVFFYDSNGRVSQVTEADIQATNGVIHIVDSVLLPDGTLADITSNVDSLSSLDGALDANGLDETLSGDGTFTVFAPTNEAVTAFVAAGGEITSDVLLYHVLPAIYFSTDIPDGETVLATANTDGDEVTVIKNETGVFVKDAIDRIATVTLANIAGTNGVAHVIDIVLSPTELMMATTEMSSTEPTEPTRAESGVNRISISTVFCITFYFLAFLIFV